MKENLLLILTILFAIFFIITIILLITKLITNNNTFNSNGFKFGFMSTLGSMVARLFVFLLIVFFMLALVKFMLYY